MCFAGQTFCQNNGLCWQWYRPQTTFLIDNTLKRRDFILSHGFFWREAWKVKTTAFFTREKKIKEKILKHKYNFMYQEFRFFLISYLGNPLQSSNSFKKKAFAQTTSWLVSSLLFSLRFTRIHGKACAMWYLSCTSRLGCRDVEAQSTQQINISGFSEHNRCNRQAGFSGSVVAGRFKGFRISKCEIQHEKLQVCPLFPAGRNAKQPFSQQQ